jgi:hypothetical protein
MIRWSNLVTSFASLVSFRIRVKLRRTAGALAEAVANVVNDS